MFLLIFLIMFVIVFVIGFVPLLLLVLLMFLLDLMLVVMISLLLLFAFADAKGANRICEHLPGGGSVRLARARGGDVQAPNLVGFSGGVNGDDGGGLSTASGVESARVALGGRRAAQSG